MKKGKLEAWEKTIVTSALNLIEICFFYKNQLFEVFLATPNVEGIVMNGILFSPEESIRVAFHDCLRSTSRFVKPDKGLQPLQFLLKLLSSNFGKISEYSSRQFFDLFNSLIEFHYSNQKDEEVDDKELFNAEILLGQIIDKLRADNRASH